MTRVNLGSSRTPPAGGLDHSRGGAVNRLGRDVSIGPNFGSRLSALAELQGAALTADEVSHVWGCFPQCRGKKHWEVREYVGRVGIGAREYRVVRGKDVQDVYRSAVRVRAAAVGAALNELESQETLRESAESDRVEDPNTP